jgi:hypothetical protein
MGRIESILDNPALQAVVGGISSLPSGSQGGLELRATQLPQP